MAGNRDSIGQLPESGAQGEGWGDMAEEVEIDIYTNNDKYKIER